LLLAQADTVEGVHGGHVGEDDLVADIEALEDFDGVDGNFAELDVDADGFGAVANELEEANGGVSLAVDGPTDIEDIPEVIEFDGAIDAEVGAGAGRKRLGELDVDGDGAVLDGGIDAKDNTFDDAIARIDSGRLTNGDVFGLSFRNLDFGFESLGVGDASEVGTGSDVLADFDGHDLEDALNSGANVERVEFTALEVVEGALLIDFGLLSLNAGAGRVLGIFGAVFFELKTNGKLFDLDASELLGDIGVNALVAKLDVDFVLDFGLLIFALDVGSDGSLIEDVAVDGDLEAFEVGFRSFELILGIESFALEDGVTEFKDDAVGLNDGAGIKKLAIDAGIRLCRNPANVLGDQRADATNVNDHGAALDLVWPDRGFVDRGSGGPETGNAKGDAGETDDGDGGIDDATDFFSACVGWSLYVHKYCLRYS
jgi:hypothetical protein